jgi:hypothetical protein
MERIDERLEIELGAPEPALADDGFSETVLVRLPRARRMMDHAMARRLSLAGAAAFGSALTLLLGVPVESLIATYAEPGELTSALLGASIVAAVLVMPVVWLLYRESVE